MQKCEGYHVWTEGVACLKHTLGSEGIIVARSLKTGVSQHLVTGIRCLFGGSLSRPTLPAKGFACFSVVRTLLGYNAPQGIPHAPGGAQTFRSA